MLVSTAKNDFHQKEQSKVTKNPDMRLEQFVNKTLSVSDHLTTQQIQTQTNQTKKGKY